MKIAVSMCGAFFASFAMVLVFMSVSKSVDGSADSRGAVVVSKNANVAIEGVQSDDGNAIKREVADDIVLARDRAIAEGRVIADRERRLIAEKRKADAAREAANAAASRVAKARELEMRRENVRAEYKSLERRWSSLEKHARETDQRNLQKKRELSQERRKIGDDYIDGKINERLWRMRLKALEGKKHSLQRENDRQAETFKQRGEKIIAEKRRVSRKAAKMGVYLN